MYKALHLMRDIYSTKNLSRKIEFYTLYYYNCSIATEENFDYQNAF